MAADVREELVTCAVDLHFLPGDLDSALQILLSVVGVTEASRGCRDCMVVQDATDASRVHYSEVWDSRDAFCEHVKSEEFRRVLLAMDMCCEEPEVFVGNLTGQKGIAHLRALRDT